MKALGKCLVYALVLVVAATAIGQYGFGGLVAAPAPMRPVYQAHAIAIGLHIFAAVVALLLGPLQFCARLRERQRRLHRCLGRIYLGVGVLFGGLAGLYMSAFAQGGIVPRLGFACLAVAWLYTGMRAFRAIRAGRVDEHRAFMMRNYALTLAAVSLRVYLPLSMIAGADFHTAYAVIAWMCWIPNLLVAEWGWNRAAAAAWPRSAVVLSARSPGPDRV